MLLGSIFRGFKPSIDHFLFACKKINNFSNNRTHEETVVRVTGRQDIEGVVRAEVGFAFAKGDLLTSLRKVIHPDLNPANCVSSLCFYPPTLSYPFHLQGYHDIFLVRYLIENLLSLCPGMSSIFCFNNQTLLFWTIYLPVHQASSFKYDSSIN